MAYLALRKKPVMSVATTSPAPAPMPRQRGPFAQLRGSPGKLASAIRHEPLRDRLANILHDASMLTRDAEAMEADEESSKCLHTLLSCNKVCFGASVIRNAARRILEIKAVDGRETDTLLETIHSESMRMKPVVENIANWNMQQRAKSLRATSARIRTTHIGVIDE